MSLFFKNCERLSGINLWSSDPVTPDRDERKWRFSRKRSWRICVIHHDPVNKPVMWRYCLLRTKLVRLDGRWSIRWLNICLSLCTSRVEKKYKTTFRGTLVNMCHLTGSTDVKGTSLPQDCGFRHSWICSAFETCKWKGKEFQPACLRLRKVTENRIWTFQNKTN